MKILPLALLLALAPLAARAEPPFQACTALENPPPAPAADAQPMPQVIVGANWAKADLTGIDLSDRLICGSDLSGAKLDGANLKGLRIGGESTLAGASLRGAKAPGAMFEDVDLDKADFSGADLTGAALGCEPSYVGEDFLRAGTCAGSIGSLKGATLTGAGVFIADPIDAGAALDGTRRHIGWSLPELKPLAVAIGPAGRITLLSGYGQNGDPITLTGARLSAALALRDALRAAIRPGFDCAKAAAGVETMICGDADLAALDKAFSDLWASLPDRAAALPAQRAWVAARAKCTDDICIRQSTVERMAAIAPLAKQTPPAPGLYRPEVPLPLPASEAGRDLGALIDMVRTTESFELKPDGTLTGSVLGSNYHTCTLGEDEAKGTPLRWTGALAGLQVLGETAGTVVVTPAVLAPAQEMHQYCGARAGWSDVYFRQ